MIKLNKNEKAPWEGVLIDDEEAQLFTRLCDKYDLLEEGFKRYEQLFLENKP